MIDVGWDFDKFGSRDNSIQSQITLDVDIDSNGTENISLLLDMNIVVRQPLVEGIQGIFAGAVTVVTIVL